MRWVVGDVQGCARELEGLLETVRFDPAKDELYTVGDLVNRGPDSLACTRLFRDAGGRGVIGNHEVYALLAFSGTRPRRGDTLDALFAAPDAEELLARLRALPPLLFLAGGEGFEPAWLVHAGLDPRWRDLARIARTLDSPPHDDVWLESEGVTVATNIRCCTAAGELHPFAGPPAERPAGFEPWDTFYRGPVRVVHGHWARRRAYRGPHTLGLDSGCVYGDVLTAWCQEDDRLVRVRSSVRAR